MELSKRDRWEIWVQDLEERLAYYLYEMKERKLLSDGKTGKICVEVLESEQKVGAWEVWLNGKKMFYFDGPMAHQRASKKAAEVTQLESAV